MISALSEPDPPPPLVARTQVVGGLSVFDRFAEVAGPDAPAVVHVHGFGVSGRYLLPTAVRLADRVRTYVPDLPGSGRSERPRPSLDIGRSVDALLAYCDAVGVERATFVGNSLGCVTLIELGVLHPDRVDALVLVSPAGGPNNQPLGRALGQLAIDGVREPIAMTRIAMRDYLRFGVVQSVGLFRAMVRFPTLERLARLEVPTLVIAGRADPLVDIGRVQELFSDRRATAAVVIDGAHALNFTHPEVVAGLIEEFSAEGRIPLRGSRGAGADVVATGEPTDRPDRGG